MRTMRAVWTLVLGWSGAFATAAECDGLQGALAQSSENAAAAVVYDKSCAATPIVPVGGVLTAKSMGIDLAGYVATLGKPLRIADVQNLDPSLPFPHQHRVRQHTNLSLSLTLACAC